MVKEGERARRLWQRVARAGLDWLVPPACRMCRAPVSDDGPSNGLFCARCLAQLADPPGRPRCRRCGLPTPEPTPSCSGCSGRPIRSPIRAVTVLGAYDGLLREAVLRCKRAAHAPLAHGLGVLLAKRIESEGQTAPPPDLVVPIPCRWTKRVRGGGDRCWLLAEPVAAVLACPVVPVLRWIRKVEKQGVLTATERRRNVAGALAVSRTYVIKGRRALLVDDVMTTGATVAEAARRLQAAGVVVVDAAVVARADRSGMPVSGDFPSDQDA